MIKGQNYNSAADCVSDYMWTKYQRNTAYYHQALINLLYSAKKLTKGNEDVVLFDKFLLDQVSFPQFVSFLTLREIFQNITKLTIMGRKRVIT
jgi:hypothetical protein